jgi:hypothetical protein
LTPEVRAKQHADATQRQGTANFHHRCSKAKVSKGVL